MSKKTKPKASKMQAIKDNEERYGKEVRQRWGNDAMDKSNAKVAGMSDAAFDQQQQLAQDILAQLKVAMATGNPAGEESRKLVQMHKEWLCGWWAEGMYSPEAHKGLGEMYVADARFTAYYNEPLGDGAAQFMCDAIHACC